MPLVPYEVPTNGVAEIALEFMLNNQQNISLFHYVYTDTAIIPDGRGFLLAMLDALNAAGEVFEKYKACISADVGVINVYAQWVHPIRYAYVTAPFTLAAGGDADASPQNVAVAITKRGTITTADAIGTLHMGGVPKSKIVNGLVVQGIGEEYTALANAIPRDLTVVELDDCSPVLYKRSAPEDSVYIAEAFVQPESRIMRRRTVGLGS